MDNKDNIRNFVRKVLKESFIEEEYPASFNMGQFKSLKSFKDRVAYCEQHLQRIAAGSSRIVYKIDEEKVLKLAKNTKGLAQNETEIQWGNDYYFKSVLAQTFESGDGNLWVEMELARKINKFEFKRLTGFDINDVNTYIRIWEAKNNGRKPIFSMDPELAEKMSVDEFIVEIIDFSNAADIEVGDFGVASSYGVVKRNGHDVLVITDYGLTKDVYSTHYDRSRKMASMYENLNEESSSNYSLENWPDGKYKGSIKGWDVYSDEIDSGFRATSGFKNKVSIPCTIYMKDGKAVVCSKGGIIFSNKEAEDEYRREYGKGYESMKKYPGMQEYL